MELIKAKLSDLPNIYSQMEQNFIHDEIRDYEDALKVFENKKYTVYHVVRCGIKVGFMCVWTLHGFSFLEHFVIYSEYRGQGYGGMALELLKEKSLALVLECELPESDMQRRRMEFYKRHGMYVNEREYWQPSYRADGERCYLRLVSTGRLEDFDKTVKEIYTEVYQTKYE